MICTLDALPLDTFFINEKQKLHLVTFNVFLKNYEGAARCLSELSEHFAMILLAWRLLMSLCSLVAATAGDCLLCTESTFFSTAFQMSKCRLKKRGGVTKKCAFCFLTRNLENLGRKHLPAAPCQNGHDLCLPQIFFLIAV